MANNGRWAPVQASQGAANVRTVCRAVRGLAGVEGPAVPRVSIRDYDAVEDLLFADVEEYLVATDWELEGQLGDRPIAVYKKRRYEVLVGRREDYGDRPQRIAQAVELIAEVEKRSELEVYWDIRSTRHGTEGAGLVVLPHDDTRASTIVNVEVPVLLYPVDRLTFYAIAAEGDAGGEQGRWTLTDNGQVAEQMDSCRKLSEPQLDLVDRALRAIEPIFPNASWDGGELAMEVGTRDLGVGIVMFSQLCALLGLVCWTTEGVTERRKIGDN